MQPNQQQLQEQYNRQALALENQDLDTFFSYFNPGYYETSRRGNVQKLDVLENLLRNPDMVRFLRYVKVKQQITEFEAMPDHCTVRVARETWLSCKPSILPGFLRWMAQIVLMIKMTDIDQWTKENDEWKLGSSKGIKSFTQPGIFWFRKQPRK